MNAEQFKAQAIQEIDIPGFAGDIIQIKVQRPKLLMMAQKGTIPNPLMGAVEGVLLGPVKDKKPDIKDLSKMVMLYCEVCMVEPKFEEVKEDMTDDQMFAIWSWVQGRANRVAPFRNDTKDGTNNNNGKTQQSKTKPNNGNRR